MKCYSKTLTIIIIIITLIVILLQVVMIMEIVIVIIVISHDLLEMAIIIAHMVQMFVLQMMIPLQKKPENPTNETNCVFNEEFSNSSTPTAKVTPSSNKRN